MTSSSHNIHLNALPRDLLDHTMDFLSGWDLLALGCVSKSMQSEVEQDQHVWKKRLPAEHHASEQDSSEPRSWKQRYTETKSLHLSGADKIPLPSEMAAKWQSAAFSVDVWFCMLPGSSNTTRPTGGVLLGAQSAIPAKHDKDSSPRPQYHQQLIHVDTSGNLYCSVTKNKRVIKSKLQLARWYHVALTFSNGLQCVYLDGALLHVVREPLHVEWAKMKELQFGSGYMTYGSKGRPSDTFVGWYGFNGLVDAHRVWGHALSMGDVQRLARGERVTTTNSRPAWSNVEPTESEDANQRFVRCSRPLERHCVRTWPTAN